MAPYTRFLPFETSRSSPFPRIMLFGRLSGFEHLWPAFLQVLGVSSQQFTDVFSSFLFRLIPRADIRYFPPPLFPHLVQVFVALQKAVPITTHPLSLGSPRLLA